MDKEGREKLRDIVAVMLKRLKVKVEVEIRWVRS